MKVLSNKQGSVLILTLIIVTFLSILALLETHQIRSQNLSLRHQRSNMLSLHIAQGAIHSVMAMLDDDKKNGLPDHAKKDWQIQFLDHNDNLKTLSWRDISRNVMGTYTVEIEDEASKINLNTTTAEILEKFLTYMDVYNAPSIAQQIIKQREQKGPSKKFDSIYEFLHISKIKLDKFVGEEAEEKGIKDFLTIMTSGHINVNTASASVLASMPGMTRSLANDIVKLRKNTPFNNLDEIKNTLSIPEKMFSEMVTWASVQSHYYTVLVTAKAKEAVRSKQVLAILDRSMSRAEIQYWRED